VSPRAEIAATPEAVSCVADAKTGVPASTEPLAMPGSNLPSMVPGSTMSPHKWAGNPRRPIKSVAHVRVFGFTSCVVVAFVNSQTALPVSQ
jgi:hypothetical protein